MRLRIDPELIEQTLLTDKMSRFGKHGVKFIKKGTNNTLICVGELAGMTLKILTIEEGN